MREFKENKKCFSKLAAKTSLIKKILGNNCGEMLIESVTSLIIFLDLVLMVSLIVTFSIRLTWSSIERGDAAQEVINTIVLQEYEDDPRIMRFTAKINGKDIPIEHDVYFLEESGFSAFWPKY